MNKRMILAISLTGVVFNAVVVYWLRIGFDNPAIRQAVYLTPPLLATIASAFAWKMYGLRHKRSLTFLFLTTGMAYWLLGEVLFDYYDYILHVSPFPSIADLFYLCAYPFFLLGMINEIKIAQVNWKLVDKAGLLLFCMVSLILVLLVFYFGIYQVYDFQSGFFENFVSMAYGIGDLLLIIVSLFLLVLALEFRGGSMSRVWTLLCGGFIFTLIADILFSFYTQEYQNHEWLISSILDSLWIGSYLLFASAFFEFGFTIQDAYKKISSLRGATGPDSPQNKNLDQTKDEFISFISHELRAPMGAVKGLVSMMLKGDYGPVPDRFRQPLTNVYISAERQIRMVNDILNISRFQSGRIRYTLLEFSLEKVTAEVAEASQSVAKQRRITLTVQTGTDTKVQGDDIWVKQILENIIGNAVKFTDTGGVTISFRMQESMATVVVTDTGIGVSFADQQKLFVKFQQLTGSVLQKTIGSGLGLYISREVARKMGGDVVLEKSEPGKGSIFLLTLPKAGSQVASETRSKLEKEGILALNNSTAKTK